MFGRVNVGRESVLISLLKTRQRGRSKSYARVDHTRDLGKYLRVQCALRNLTRQLVAGVVQDLLSILTCRREATSASGPDRV